MKRIFNQEQSPAVPNTRAKYILSKFNIPQCCQSLYAELRLQDTYIGGEAIRLNSLGRVPFLFPSIQQKV